jgi:hypothetical protein
MKIGKIHKTSRILKVLLGLAVAGALLLTSCQNIFDMAEQKTQPTDDDGYGYVVVDLGDFARTIKPDPASFSRVIYTFKAQGDLFVEVDLELPANVSAFRLPVGTYKLDVRAYMAQHDGADDGTGTNTNYPLELSATGSYNSSDGTFPIAAGQTTNISVLLTPAPTNAGNTNRGTFKVRIVLPADAKGVYTLRQYIGSGQQVWQNITVASGTSGFTNWDNSAGKLEFDASLPAGSYLFTGRINTDSGKYGGFSEAVHIVPYMTTDFAPNYVTNQYALASLTEPEEAIAILTSEIKDWIAAGVLTTVNDGIDLSTDGTIRLNYVAYKSDGDLTFAGSTFPLTPQAGWAVDSTASPGGLNVGDKTEKITVNLHNPEVATNKNTLFGLTNSPKATYILELYPVVEYTVAFGPGVDQNPPTGGARGISIQDSVLDTVLSAPGSANGVAGSTSITINNAAITINGFEALETAPGVHTFTAVSRPYNIVIYQTAKEQVTLAFETLRANIQSWAIQSQALARVDPQLDSASSTTPPIADHFGGFDTVTLYYVASRLTAPQTTFNIIVPNSATETRWDNDDWNLTTPYAKEGDTKRIGFKPHGGTKVSYTVKLIPVSEFYVNWADPTYTTTVSSTAKVQIKDDGEATLTNDFTYANGTGDFTLPADLDDFDDPATYRGKRYRLNSTTITLTETVITIDMPTDDPANPNTDDIDVNTSDAINSALPTSDATRAIFANLVKDDPNKSSATDKWGGTAAGAADHPDNTDLVATKTFTPLSREYHIKVYRPIATAQIGQLPIARAELRGETDAAKWTTGTVNAPNGIVATTNAADNRSDLVYVGSSAPTLAIRIDYASDGTTPVLNWADKGWQTTIPDSPAPSGGANPDAYGSLSKSFSFLPKGGYVEKDVYRFVLIPAVQITVTYKTKPFSRDPVTGNLQIAGSGLGAGATAINLTPSATVPATAPLLIGKGAITITTTTSGNQNIIATSDDSYATKAVGASIASPDSTVYDIAVYPSIKDQQDDVFAGLKALKSLAAWGGATITNNVKDIPATGGSAATDPATGFWVVGSNPTLTVPTNPAFVESSYTSALTVDNTTNTASPGANGAKPVEIKFEPLGGVSADARTYTFNITTVAQYNVNFMNGPTGIRATGNVKINKHVPGTNGTAEAHADPITVTHLDSPPGVATIVYGGIGDFVTNVGSDPVLVNASIETGNNNIFSTTIAADESWSTPNATKESFGATTAKVLSRVYDIRVYPPIDQQQRDVVAKLRAVNSNTNWFSGTPDLKTQITRVGTSDISEVQYLGATEPTVVTTSFGLQTGTGYTGTGSQYILTAVPPSGTEAGAPAGSGWQLVQFNFTPIGDTTPIANIYNFRLIPVVEYKVIYTNGATGTIIIKPVNRPNQVTTTNLTPITINSTMPESQRTVLGGLSATTPIEISATEGQYNRVEIRYGTTIMTPTLTPPGSSAGAVQSSNYATTSQTYEIWVIKN